ncbi:TPA: PTS transporter subunit EIIC [Staphylococcus aureus]|uniref:PTS system MurNAc-GlcNAc-specific EIIBC component n=2 Tax=Staphylococcus aureus TaxID=1280 RepID=A0A0U1MVP2_STAAU|nr:MULTISPECIES: PTS transporter subunit EIIC [Staphylococcus]EHM79819.1 PTS family porter, EIIC [Staphylococcus aureus subsp. aureus 21194]EHO94084.1 PTS family porter, EIIC [Staphylococcus aureus subsp. aureus 21252]EHT71876.1 phosphotransferase system, EIIC family protein [Staphylococcus aureus subsp. aureus CIG290]EHT72847.1 phosphotransferase system, EIIC family protein [Staphylococcus aureus subsp. aureus CIG290]EJO9597601.1 PTS transporter subunit EIIC [Staphylococcus aureus]
MTKEQQLAERIIAAVGGMDNIDSVMNCMTRVRIKVLDENKVDDQELRHIDGVMGVIHDERIQVVVGPGTVNKVANHMAELSGVKLGDRIPHNHNDSEKMDYKSYAADKAKANKEAHKAKQKNGKLNKVLKSIANIFIPLIPAFIGAGLIGGIAAVLSNLMVAGYISGAWITQLITVFNVIKDGMLAYLAIFTGINAAKEFGATPGLGGVIGGTTLLTGIAGKNILMNVFTGEPLQPGQGGIIGVIFAVWILSIVEKRLHKIVPNAIDIIVTPTIALLIVGLLTIFIFMPLAGFVSDSLVSVVNGIISIGGVFSGFIIGASFLPLVMLGLHHIFTPIHIEMINQSGATYLLPIAAMAGAGQVGAALALWVRCKRNTTLRNTLKGALPVGFLGIGEPLIYGVTLPLGRPFLTACIGGGIGGAVIGGIGHIGAKAIGPSGVSLLPLISDNMYLGYIAGLLAAYAGGFVCTYLFGTTKAMRQTDLLGD